MSIAVKKKQQIYKTLQTLPPLRLSQKHGSHASATLLPPCRRLDAAGLVATWWLGCDSNRPITAPSIRGGNAPATTSRLLRHRRPPLRRRPAAAQPQPSHRPAAAQPPSSRRPAAAQPPPRSRPDAAASTRQPG